MLRFCSSRLAFVDPRLAMEMHMEIDEQFYRLQNHGHHLGMELCSDEFPWVRCINIRRCLDTGEVSQSLRLPEVGGSLV